MEKRFTHSAAEAKYPWLTTILDTFHISDQKTTSYLQVIEKNGVKPACKRGCDACCTKPTVPFTEPELKAISWYASEVLAGEIRPIIKKRLLTHKSTLECPFLVDHGCAIYAVRPLICRQFMVAKSPCGTDEDILTTRPEDIISLPKDTVIKPVAMRLLDDFGFNSVSEKQIAFHAGYISQVARNMHQYDWTRIATTMDHFEHELQH